MTNIEIDELISVLEKIRISQYPDIPASLIEDIVKAEFVSQDNRENAQRTIHKVINDFLKNISI